jgi:hypothetical protein
MSVRELRSGWSSTSAARSRALTSVDLRDQPLPCPAAPHSQRPAPSIARPRSRPLGRKD